MKQTAEEKQLIKSFSSSLKSMVGLSLGQYECESFITMVVSEHSRRCNQPSQEIKELTSDEELKRLIWEEWEGEIKEEDPRQMVFKYMKLMRSESITLLTKERAEKEELRKETKLLRTTNGIWMKRVEELKAKLKTLRKRMNN